MSIRCTNNQQLAAVALVAVAGTVAVGEAAPQQQTGPQTITMAQLDDNPQSLAGKQVKVEAEVQEVLGPRLFTIDEQEWFDFDGDTLVFLHAPFAGLISEDARVTVTGTVQPFVLAEVEREWGVFDLDPGIEVEFRDRPILVATSVKSDEGVELAVSLAPPPAVSDQPAGQAQATGTTGTAGSAGAAPITDIGQLATATDKRFVGRRVSLAGARVVAEAWDGSVWVSTAQGRGRLLVVPSDPEMKAPGVGQTVRIEGVVLEAPESVYARARQEKKGDGDETIYVFASAVQPVQG